jgi:hypothetical protein
MLTWETVFITRANGPFWSSIPSWQLTGAILLVDILATMFCLFGWFIGGNTSIVAIVRVWVSTLLSGYSLSVSLVRRNQSDCCSDTLA